MKRDFQGCSNYLSFALALIPSVLMYIFNPGYSVPYVFFLILLFLFLLSAWLNLKQFFDYKDRHPVPIELIRCINGTILCKPNNLLTHGSVVSFYEYQEEFEKYISSGRVVNISSKGVAQISLFDTPNSLGSDAYEYISAHQSNIIVKPTITFETIQNLQINL